ncbi:MAG: cytosine deaminase [Fusobacteriaceae bacterium]
MLIKNAKLRNSNDLVDILISDGKFSKIEKKIEGEFTKIIDACGNIVMEPFVEPHIHLDTAMSAGEPRWNMSGTLFEGIECWSERKAILSFEDVKARARKALKWQISNGIQFVRTHIDVTDPTLMALKAMVELKEEMKKFVEIQIVAFPQEGILSYPNGEALLEEALKNGADVIGAIPHFEYQRDWGVESIRKIVKLAVKYNRLIDVHCDEIDDEQSRFLEVLAAEAWAAGIGPKVTASHTTAMGSYNDAYTYKLFRLLKESEINFVANPLVNIHLGGRFDTYPKRRGVTRVKELLEAGINVCFGHDDIFDPWYPLGNGNMISVVNMGLHVCHMMGYEEISKSLDMISKNSAKTLCIEDHYGIEIGKPGNCIILSEDNDFDVVRLQATVTHSIREGKIIAESTPKQSKIFLMEEEKIDFKR